ncbi:MAG: NUDIX hydrolase [Defluviicoccus sp.]|nr:NUDIX hydrolase [Defluviicoccus sp.]
MTDDRLYPERPFVGVGVAVLRGSDVLLIRRAKPPVSDRWSIPGGAQEIGETVREAALREVAEETGLAVEIVGLVDVVDGITRDAEGRARYHYTLVDFAARWVSGEARAGSDAAAVRWVGRDALAAIPMWDETRRIVAAAAEMVAGAR